MSAEYQNFVGVDIAKKDFFVSVYGQDKDRCYTNDPMGISQFAADYSHELKTGFCVLEVTGGYELNVLQSLLAGGNVVHRADTRKAKNFVRSYSSGAKTDKLDARALARYGAERWQELKPFEFASPLVRELFALAQRRSDLSAMIVSEKNRLENARDKWSRESIKKLLKFLSKAKASVDELIEEKISSDKELYAKYKELQTIPGIGKICAATLAIMLPELGQCNRRQIASLTGLAPIANDSGQKQGYRATGRGRSGIKPILFMAAMAARNSNSKLKEFYERLIARGKKKMVALTALMRKIIVIANARLKEFFASQQPAA